MRHVGTAIERDMNFGTMCGCEGFSLVYAFHADGRMNMKNLLKALVLGAAVLSIPAVAFAQTTTITTTTRTERGPVVLTPDQRTTVYKRVVRERVVTPRGEVIEYQVGARVPREVELRTFDDDVYVEAPELKQYRYVRVNNQLVLVDPETSEVVQVISD
jgi:hypothetical protein